ncbi:MAG TPA: alcohol dehydrogenase catalytic domain-containing protein, partial [Puia sp.]|nr:alcohol dehydrogenase catalytic domain-containing protein [Puia sp.]
MKALVITDRNAPLIIQELPDLRAGPGEAIVRIHAASLNHRDVWIQKGQYAGLKYPIVPGSDGAGVVVETVQAHDAVVPGDWTGKEVIINPALFWGRTSAYQDPKSFRILGLP